MEKEQFFKEEKLNLEQINNQNKFLNEFIKRKKIGKGGFSQVYEVISKFQAVSKIDQQTYAIKTITLKNTKSELTLEEKIEKILREVRVLARTNHPNVLRYFNSWFEIQYDQNRSDYIQNKKINLYEMDNSDSEYQLNLYDDCGNQIQNMLQDSQQLEDYSKEQHLNSLFKSDENPLKSLKNQQKKKTLEQIHINNNQSNDNFNKIKQPAPRKISNNNHGNYKVEMFLTPPLPDSKKKLDKIKSLKLYIQTEILDFTLENYLSNRNEKYQQINNDILINESFWIIDQILQGVQYIHEFLQTVHRDIKPTNIFMNSNLELKIGDMGLIKPVNSLITNGSEETQELSKQSNRFQDDVITVSSQPWSNSNSGACGTHNYASPEQLSDSVLKYIDFKSDIYSLGIVFLQIFHVMQTAMELHKTMKECRNQQLPKTFQEEFPEIADLILKMINRDPQQRPTLYVSILLQQTKSELYLIKKKFYQKNINLINVQIQLENEEEWKQVHVSLIKKYLCFYDKPDQEKAYQTFDLSICAAQINEDHIFIDSEIQINCSIKPIILSEFQFLKNILQPYQKT